MKSELESIKTWYEYNSYVRKKYLKAIFENLKEEDRYKDRGASFPSIVDIFVHTVDAYRYWFRYIYPDRYEDYKKLRGTERFTLQRLQEEEYKIDSYVLSFIRSLKEEDLDRTLAIDGKKLGWRASKISLRQMLLHLIEEELQHRGELNALFWQLDIGPPITDLFDWTTETKGG